MAAAGASRQARPGQRLAVAASGGLDSTALLHCVHRLCAPLGIGVHALHVHHGLHPDASAWQEQLRRQCARWSLRSGSSIDFAATRLAGRPAAGESVEAWARRERYAALTAMARDSGCRIVLLAHHRLDQAETVLLQALRGAGPAGLAAMPREVDRGGVRWLRPWLDQPRSRIEAYARRWRLAHVDDPGNADRRFARNRLRHDVWPALVAAFPAAETTLGQVARRAHEVAELALEMATVDLPDVSDDEGLRVDRWQRLGEARRANVLRCWAAAALRSPVPESLIERLMVEMPACRAARWPAPGGGELRLHRGRLVAAAPSGGSGRGLAERAIDLSRPGTYRADPWPGVILVSAADAAQGGAPAAALRNAVLRPRQGGERFQAAPGAMPRSLKKQYQAAGVAAWAREGPLVFAGERLLFVPGLGIDVRAAQWPGDDRRMLRWMR